MGPVEIDGTAGEGGGQILRSALTLSLLTGYPFHIHGIRRHRGRPGLQPQHLAAVRAAAAVCNARLTGASLHSQGLTFEPGPVHSGRFDFDIGTAGTTSLLLQTVYLPLALTGKPSRVTVRGGTHIPLSPCFHYLDYHWCPVLANAGLEITLELEQAGFYPVGGGIVHASVSPCRGVAGVELTERGPLHEITGVSASANLPDHIVRRQRDQALRRLRACGLSAEIPLEELVARSPGTVLLLLVRFRHSQACFFALGARGKPAEQVADAAVDALLAFLAGDGAIDSYLADQLLLPLGMARTSSRLRTATITTHLLTNTAVIQRFLPVEITIEGNLGESGEVGIYPR